MLLPVLELELTNQPPAPLYLHQKMGRVGAVAVVAATVAATTQNNNKLAQVKIKLVRISCWKRHFCAWCLRRDMQSSDPFFVGFYLFVAAFFVFFFREGNQKSTDRPPTRRYRHQPSLAFEISTESAMSLLSSLFYAHRCVHQRLWGRVPGSVGRLVNIQLVTPCYKILIYVGEKSHRATNVYTQILPEILLHYI